MRLRERMSEFMSLQSPISVLLTLFDRNRFSAFGCGFINRVPQFCHPQTHFGRTRVFHPAVAYVNELFPYAERRGQLDRARRKSKALCFAHLQLQTFTPNPRTNQTPAP